MQGMFSSAADFTGGGVQNWDVSNVVNFNYMFYNAQKFNADLSSWNTAKATVMRWMFAETNAFTGTGLNSATWDVSKVKDFNEMFKGATIFNGDLSGWTTSFVTDFEGMFYGAVVFDKNLASWDITAATNLYQTFRGASALTGAGLNSWTTSTRYEIIARNIHGRNQFHWGHIRLGCYQGNGPYRHIQWGNILHH